MNSTVDTKLKGGYVRPGRKAKKGKTDPYLYRRLRGYAEN
jgi:hypothetical protein